jgi:hypothetical protein
MAKAGLLPKDEPTMPYRFRLAPELLVGADTGDRARTSDDREPAYSTRPEAFKPKILSITSAPWVSAGRSSCR